MIARVRERGLRRSWLIVVALPLLGACSPSRGRPEDRGTPQARVVRGSPSRCAPLADAGAAVLRFAVIGDYGDGSSNEAEVARMVTAWRPDFVVTVGDNNYPAGEAATIDAHIGQYFHAFIAPYAGLYGAGADRNRFFPSLGNHDLLTDGGAPYLEYFVLPGNERYYDVAWGNVHLFALDSDPSEPDGVTEDSVQGAWLQARLQAATERFRIVYMHHPPYSSGPHGSTSYMQWPFRRWGANLVLSGHDHAYERLEVEGQVYIVCGLGGAPEYTFGDPKTGSEVRYVSHHGAGLVEVGADLLRFRFQAVNGAVIDDFCLMAGP